MVGLGYFQALNLQKLINKCVLMLYNSKGGQICPSLFHLSGNRGELREKEIRVRLVSSVYQGENTANPPLYNARVILFKGQLK